MLQKNFKVHTNHIDGCHLQLATNQQKFVTIADDDIIFQCDVGNSQQKRTTFNGEQRLKISCVSVHPKNDNSFAFGTEDGMVFYMKTIHHLDLGRAELIFKGRGPISRLEFSKEAKLLSICLQEQKGYVYHLGSKRFSPLPQSHDGFLCNVSMSADERYIYSMGMDGRVFLYHNSQPARKGQAQSQEEDLFEQIQNPMSITTVCSYKISSSSALKQMECISAAFDHRDSETMRLLCGGNTTLQAVDFNSNTKSSNYLLITNVHAQQELCLVSLMQQNHQYAKCIVLTTAATLAIWSYFNEEKILSINLRDHNLGAVSQLEVIQCQPFNTFVVSCNKTNSNGSIYEFTNLQLIKNISQKKEPVQSLPQQEQQMQKAPTTQKLRQHESIAAKLIPQVPQYPIEQSYKEYENARFVFYNNVGCVVERYDQDNSSTLELQFHDRSKIRRINMLLKNKSYAFYALRESIFVYAASNHVVFQHEKQLKAGHASWEIRWQDIQGIALGSSWLAVSNKQQIKIFDFVANELHSIAFDRQFMAIDAFQDKLAIVYHGSAPMWGCQSLKMKVYAIDTNALKLEMDVKVPIKPNSQLKWFGFSADGMIFSQDTSQNLRLFCFEGRTWTTLLSLNQSNEHFFVQHIENMELYGFRLQNKNGEKQQPKVLPRSLPRKVNFEIPQMKLDFLNEQERPYINKLFLKNLMIKHEQFRYKSWMKYKYSRSKDNINYASCQSIKTQDQIKTLKTQVDTQLYDYLKKFMSKTSLRQTQHEKSLVSEIMMICNRISHFEETMPKITNLIKQNSNVYLPNYFAENKKKTVETETIRRNRTSELSFLDRMVEQMMI